jgi:hypothetical protein
MYCCMLVAALGFSLGLTVHIASISGKATQGALPVMDLHIGIFVVWFPAVLVVSSMTGSPNRKDLWKIALSGYPLWMRRGHSDTWVVLVCSKVLVDVGRVRGEGIHVVSRTTGEAEDDAEELDALVYVGRKKLGWR